MRLAVGPDGVRRAAPAPVARGRADHGLPDRRRVLPVASVVGQQLAGRRRQSTCQSADIETAAGRSWRIPEGGFWQVHPGAADIAGRRRCSTCADVRPDDRCLDLYAGVGLFAGVLAATAHEGRIFAVESDGEAAAAAAENLADLPNVTVVTDQVTRWLTKTKEPADLVVLDPPRRGAGG